MNKLLSFKKFLQLLGLLILYSLNPISLEAAVGDDFEYEGIFYTVTSEEEKTCRTKNGTESRGANPQVYGDLIIPSTVHYNNESYTVTGIGFYSFANNQKITSLKLPETIETIEEGGFIDCKGITGELILPEKLTFLGQSAFSTCRGLTGSLFIPDSVTKIGNEAFRECSGFSGSLTIGNSVTTIGSGAFFSCKGLTGSLTIPDSVTTIGEFAFCNCSGFSGSLTIPDSVTKIGESAFHHCSGFTGSLTIPDSVTTIGKSAFSDCPGFTGSLTIPDSVTTIGDYAFCECSGFTGSLTIGNSVTTIGKSAFEDCSGFNGTLTLGNSVTTIGDNAFHELPGFHFKKIHSFNPVPPKCGIRNFDYSFDYPLYVPDESLDRYKTASVWRNFKKIYSIDEDPEYVTNFEYNGILYSIISEAEKTVKTRNGGYKYGHQNLTGSLIIPSTVEYSGESYTVVEIGAYSFYQNKNLTGELIFPETLLYIGDLAFYDCSGFTGSLTIPDSVTTIGLGAFQECSGLEVIKLPSSVETIGQNAFSGCSGLGNINIPGSVQEIGESILSGCSSLTTLIIDDSEDPIQLENSCFKDSPISYLYMGRNWIYPNNSKGMVPYIQNLVFGAKVTEIPQYSFENSMYLESVVIPVSISTLGNFAFSNCNSLTTLEYNAINCSSFGNNVFPGTIENLLIGNEVTQIPDYFLMNGNKIQFLEIPNSVKSIGDYAFIDSFSLKSLWLGTGIQKINKSGFYEWGSMNVERRVYDIPKIFWLSNTPPEDSEFLRGMMNFVSNNQYDFSNQKQYQFLSSKFLLDDVIYVPLQPSDRTCDVVDCLYTENNEFVNIKNSVINQGIELKVKDINDYAFYDNDIISGLSLANNGVIGSYAFYSCENIPEVDMPNTITGLGVSSFQDCVVMTSVNISESVPSLPDYVFSGCESLPSISVPSNVELIGQYAFKDCTSLTNVRFEESFIDEDNDGSFDEMLLYLASNGDQPLFKDCPLNSVFIGRRISYNSEPEYGYSPFYRNETLQAAEITDRETQVYDNEFYGCSGLKTLYIGNGVTSIGKWAFSGCFSLQYFSAGYNVETIGEEAFSDCTGMTQYYSYSINPPVCGAQSLDDINKWNCTLYVPAERDDEYYAADQWKDFFYIKEMDPVAMERIELDVTELLMDANTTYQLQAKIIPGNTTHQDLIWSSSDMNIATVSQEGLVTALKNGSVIITASSAEFGIEAYCNITVEAGIILAESITITSVSMEGTEGKSDLKPTELLYLFAKVEPADATNQQVVWSTSPEGLVEIVSENEDGSEICLEVKENLSLQNVTVTASVDGTPAASANYVIKISDLLYGDANDNGLVTVADVITIANEILSKQSEETSLNENFCFVNADVDCNRIIEVVDQAATVNLALGKEAFSASTLFTRSVAGNDYLIIDDFETGDKQIDVILKNASSYIGIQADFIIPKGMEIKGVIAGEQSLNHTVSFNMIEENKLRVIVYSLSNHSFADADKPMFTINAQINSVYEDLEIVNIVAVDESITRYELDSRGGRNLTRSILIDPTSYELRVYGGNGEVIITGAEGSDLKIFNMAGQLIKTLNVNLPYQRIPIVKGIYLITLDNNSYKVNVN